MKKTIAVLLLVFAFTSVSKAQDYNWGIGLRGGGIASGISVKGFIGGASALEGIVSFVNGVNIYGLYERHVPVIGKGFNFYYGGGANIGSWEKHGYSEFTMGVDGVVGLEYKISNVPLTIGADYKPNVNFIGHTGFGWYDFGITARVAF